MERRCRGRHAWWAAAEVEPGRAQAVLAVNTLNGTDLGGRNMLVREDREDRDVKAFNRENGARSADAAGAHFSKRNIRKYIELRSHRSSCVSSACRRMRSLQRSTVSAGLDTCHGTDQPQASRHLVRQQSRGPE